MDQPNPGKRRTWRWIGPLGFLCLVLACWLGPLPWSTIWVGMTASHMVLCRKGMDHPCTAEWDGTVHRLMPPLIRHFFWKLLWRERSSLILVGPSEDPWRDLQPFEPLMPLANMVLIDANPNSCHLLRLKYTGHANVHILNAIVTNNTTETGTVPFYQFSPKVLERFPQVNLLKLWYDSSLDRSHLEETHRFHFGKNVLLRHGYNFSAEEWESMLDYIEAQPVPVLAPADVLRIAGLKAKDVDILVTDAEGADYDIIRDFLALPEFSPVAIQYEYRIFTASQTAEPMMQHVFSEGYTIMYMDYHNQLGVREH